MPRRSTCAKVPYRSRAAARAALKLLRAGHAPLLPLRRLPRLPPLEQPGLVTAMEWLFRGYWVLMLPPDNQDAMYEQYWLWAAFERARVRPRLAMCS